MGGQSNKVRYSIGRVQILSSNRSSAGSGSKKKINRSFYAAFLVILFIIAAYLLYLYSYSVEESTTNDYEFLKAFKSKIFPIQSSISQVEQSTFTASITNQYPSQEILIASEVQSSTITATKSTEDSTPGGLRSGTLALLKSDSSIVPDQEVDSDRQKEEVDKKRNKKGRSRAVDSSSISTTLVDGENKKNKKSQAKIERPQKKNKPKKKRFKDELELYNFQPEWGYRGEWKYIQVLSTLKIPLKKDRRVVFPNLTITKPGRLLDDQPSGVLGSPRELVKANNILKMHPFHQNDSWSDGSLPLEDVMVLLKNSPHCLNLQPIFLTMATVGDDLYWQLIENFIYTMVKFNTSECSFVICVSDLNCMHMCQSAFFPCYNYQETLRPLPSVMEQIARVKLLHIPKALDKSVDVFMLDLDVGFLEDPKYMVQAFRETPIVDIFVQVHYTTHQ